MRNDIRFAATFAGSGFGGIYLHEIGHAVFGWIQGIPVVPTPAKEYVLLTQLDWHQSAWISLGGVIATIAFVVGMLLWYVGHDALFADPALAGALLPVGFYTVRFLLVGRGHDGLEWQAAQSAVGANPSGHIVDVAFLILFLVGCVTWIVRRRHSIRWTSLLRASGLAVVGIALIIAIQVANNATFDRFFPKPIRLNIPAGIETTMK